MAKLIFKSTRFNLVDTILLILLLIGGFYVGIIEKSYILIIGLFFLYTIILYKSPILYFFDDKIKIKRTIVFFNLYEDILYKNCIKFHNDNGRSWKFNYIITYKKNKKNKKIMFPIDIENTKKVIDFLKSKDVKVAATVPKL